MIEGIKSFVKITRKIYGLFRKASSPEYLSLRIFSYGHSSEKVHNQPDIFSGCLCISVYASCNEVIISASLLNQLAKG